MSSTTDKSLKTREFQTQLLHYFFKSNNKSNHHHANLQKKRKRAADEGGTQRERILQEIILDLPFGFQ